MSVRQPDAELCLSTLEDHEREAVESFAHSLGLDDWTACPPLRRVVLMVSALRMAADMHPGLSTAGKLREACYVIGAGPSSSRFATSIDRQLLRWQGAADHEMRTIDPPDKKSALAEV